MRTSLAQQPEGVRQPSLPAMMPRRAWSLKAHLLVFGVALVLPMLALAAFLIISIASSARDELENRMVQIASGLAAEIDREIQRRVTVLQTLATSPALARSDFATFHAYASAVLSDEKAGIFLIDPSSLQQLLNTYVPFGTELPTYGSPETAQRVLETKRWQVSEFFVGRVSKKPALDIDLPILGNGAVQYILVMGLEPFMFEQIVQAQKLPADWAVNIADRTGTILVRSKDQDKNVGTKLPAELIAQVPDTVARVASLEGVEVLRTAATSQLSGWQIAINVPAGAAERPLRDGLIYLGLWSTAALLLTGLVASWFAGMMSRPITAAAEAAAALAHRRRIAPLRSSVAEANTLIEAISSAAQDLSRTDDIRRAAEEQHQRADESLRESERRLQHALAAGRMGAWEWHIAARRVIWSETLEQIHGLNPGTFGGTFDDFKRDIHPEDLESVLRQINETVAQRRDYHVVYRMKRPDGAVRWLEALGRLEFGADDTPSKLAGVCIDITERKRVEDSERLLAAELSHRTKNLFAVVQALAMRSLRRDRPLDEAREAFLGRLRALIRADTSGWRTPRGAARV